VLLLLRVNRGRDDQGAQGFEAFGCSAFRPKEKIVLLLLGRAYAVAEHRTSKVRHGRFSLLADRVPASLARRARMGGVSGAGEVDPDFDQWLDWMSFTSIARARAQAE
jgi:hypothetical protein